MNWSLLGSALAFVICGIWDYRKHGWLPLHKPVSFSPGHLAGWLIDRTYLLYAAMAVAAVIVSAWLGP